jgi:hypothetical protein
MEQTCEVDKETQLIDDKTLVNRITGMVVVMKMILKRKYNLKYSPNIY